MLVQNFLENSAARLPDKVALVCDDQEWTYHQINHAANQFSAWLLNMGLRHQDRVVIYLENSVEAVVSLFGILKAGGIFIALNSDMKARKLKYILKDTGARVLITHTSKARVVRDAVTELSDLEHIIWCSSQVPKLFYQKQKPRTQVIKHHLWKDILSEHPGIIASRPRAKTTDLDLATIIYTSGSTGYPQGVMSAHFNMIAAARSIVEYLENVEDDVIMNAFPLSFDYGLYQVLMAFLFGGTVVLETSFAYPYKIIERLVQMKITGFPIVPTIAALLLQMKDLGKFDFSCLRYITNTADRLPVETIRKLQTIFPHARIYSMYGLTECKRVSYLAPNELQHKPKSVGKPMPAVEAFVVDDSGRELGPDEIGELVVKGPNVMQGYWNDPDATSRTFRPGKSPGTTLLYTGDLFKKDKDGFFYFIARKDDLIKTKSQRVNPREIENVLCEVDGVLEAAVVGIPDKIIGRSIQAIITSGNRGRLTKDQIFDHCRKNLERFMVPRFIEFRNSLPRLSNGKIDRKRIIAELSQ